MPRKRRTPTPDTASPGAAVNDAPQADKPDSVSAALASEGVVAPSLSEEAPKRRGRPRKEETPAVPAYDWRPLGPLLKTLADPVYRSLRVPPEDLPSEEAWSAFCIGWGGVVTHYFPITPDSPWPAATVGTLVIAAPLIKVYATAQPVRSFPSPSPVGLPRRIPVMRGDPLDVDRPEPPETPADDVGGVFLGTRPRA